MKILSYEEASQHFEVRRFSSKVLKFFLAFRATNQCFHWIIVKGGFIKNTLAYVPVFHMALTFRVTVLKTEVLALQALAPFRQFS